MISIIFMFAFNSNSFAEPNRFTWDQLSPNQFSVAEPPRSGSIEEEADFQTLQNWQQIRTKAQCDRAASQEIPTFGAIFGKPWGVLTKTERRRLSIFMNRVILLGSRISQAIKKDHDRPRPYRVDPSLRPCIRKPKGNRAYPSSHATAGALAGCVLSRIILDRAQLATMRGAEVGELRIIGGVHHPSDVIAGQTLGNQICQALFLHPDFLKEVRSKL